VQSVRFSKLSAGARTGSDAPTAETPESPADGSQDNKTPTRSLVTPEEVPRCLQHREARYGLRTALCQPKGNMWKPISADTYGMELSTNPYR